MKPTLRLIGSFVFIMILLVLLFSYAMFQGGFVSWFLFYSFLPIALYLLGFLFYPIRKWNVSRLLSEHVVHSGDHMTITITIKRKLPFPLYYCVFEDVIPDSLNQIDQQQEKYKFMNDPKAVLVKRQTKKISFPWFRRVIKLKYDLNYLPRGEHMLDAVRIKTGDLFGFITKEHVFKAHDELIVYPSIRPILLDDRLSSLSQGGSSSLTINRQQTNAVSGIRDYHPGDKMSWIHWKQTARKNTVMTKEFEQEKSHDPLLVMDHSNYQGLNPLAFEGIIEVAVALIESFKKKSLKFDFLSIGAESHHFSYRQNIFIEEAIKQHLVSVNPSSDQPFALKLKEEMLRYQANLSMMIITTQLDTGLVQTLKHIKQRQKNITLFYIHATKKSDIQYKNVVTQLNYLGIKVYRITEKELIKTPIEVII